MFEYHNFNWMVKLVLSLSKLIFSLTFYCKENDFLHMEISMAVIKFLLTELIMKCCLDTLC